MLKEKINSMRFAVKEISILNIFSSKSGTKARAMPCRVSATILEGACA